MSYSIRERLIAMRQAKGLSRRALQDRTGIREMAIWRYESGRNDPSGEVVFKLCLALNISADYLLGLSGHIKKVDLVLDTDAIRDCGLGFDDE